MALNSNIDICNLALGHLGANKINNIETPTTKEEIICANYYDIARQNLYRDCRFQFTMCRTSLPKEETQDTFIFKNTSAKFPKDYIDLLYLVFRDRILFNDGKTYRINGNRIITNLEAPYNICYIKDITDVSEMTSDFKLLLSFYLATLIANNLGASVDKLNYCMRQYEELLIKVKAHNGLDVPPFNYKHSKYINEYENI